MSGNGEAAARYARFGWPVFPCRPDGKEPATRHGVHDADTDPATVARFWTRHPDANVGIATGTPGPTVLDVDIAHGKPGHASLNQAIRAGLIRPPMATVRTPSGGSHLYYAGDEQRNASMAGHGLDLRGQGGYVVAPPSAIAGRRYEIVGRHGDPASIDFDAIRRHFQPQRPDRPSPSGDGWGARRLPGWVTGLTEGNRNAGLFWAACRAAEAGDRDVLDAIARAAARTGLDAAAIAKTIASAVRTASQDARDLEAG